MNDSKSPQLTAVPVRFSFGTAVAPTPGATDPAPSVPAKKNKAGRYPPRVYNRVGARTSEYTPPGSTVAGLTKDNQPSRIVHEVHYSLSDEARATLTTDFPGVAVVCVGAQHHDHPVAHTRRAIVWQHSVINQLGAGQKVMDLNGDWSLNERLNLKQGARGWHITTVAPVETPRDAVRQARWGARVVDGKERWMSCSVSDLHRHPESDRYALLADQDVLLMNHCLYYYDFSEICALVNARKASDARPGIRLLAVIHRFGDVKKGTWSDRAGTINNGEQAWTRVTGPDGVSRVTQVNWETNEPYEHEDVEKWFKNFDYANEAGGMAWTIRKGCDNHYVVEVTSCPSALVPPAHWAHGRRIVTAPGDDERVIIEASKEEKALAAPPQYVEAVREVNLSVLLGGAGHKVSLPGVADVVKVPVTHPKLLESLEMWMVNRPRDAKTYRDLTAKAQRLAGNSTLIGGTGVALEITPSQLRDTIALAFVSGVAQESGLAGILGQGGIRQVCSVLSGKGRSFNDPGSVVRGLLQLSCHIAELKRGASERRVLEIYDEWV